MLGCDARGQILRRRFSFFFDTATTDIYTLSLHDALPILVHDFWLYRGDGEFVKAQIPGTRTVLDWFLERQRPRSEEHTSELQSRRDLVCRLLLEKKNQIEHFAIHRR